eukprot:2572243-Pleurochrysis_carterae.AAC.1
MEPSKNIALLLYDTETSKTVEISPVWPALNFTYANLTMFTLHPDIIAKAVMYASFNPIYDDPYNVRRYKLLRIQKISYKSQPIWASRDDFFPVLDDDEATQDEIEGANVWGDPTDYY